MARARNIKFGFYENEELAECSLLARFIFPGLWMLADREGRLEDRPRRLKAKLLPFDDGDMDALLQELHDHGFLVRYTNEDGKFIQILKFKEHQSPHYSEKQSVIKPPILPESSEKTSDVAATKSPGVVTEKSGSPPRKNGSSRGGRNPLIPDSPNPESMENLAPKLRMGANENRVLPLITPEKPNPVVTTGTAEKPSVAVWEHYRLAYLNRYGAEPVRNAKVNGQIARLVERLGASESPLVAEFYVTHNSPLYVRSRHPVDLLLRDAEGLRTQWVTGCKATSAEARNAETGDSLREQVNRVEEMLRDGTHPH